MKKLSLVAIAATLAFAAPVSATETVAIPTVSTQAAPILFGGMSTAAAITTIVVIGGVVAAVADSSSGTN